MSPSFVDGKWNKMDRMFRMVYQIAATLHTVPIFMLRGVPQDMGTPSKMCDCC
jgi:hypothetical protein